MTARFASPANDNATQASGFATLRAPASPPRLQETFALHFAGVSLREQTLVLTRSGATWRCSRSAQATPEGTAATRKLSRLTPARAYA